jgi:hypothetical protein
MHKKIVLLGKVLGQLDSWMYLQWVWWVVVCLALMMRAGVDNDELEKL